MCLLSMLRASCVLMCAHVCVCIDSLGSTSEMVAGAGCYTAGNAIYASILGVVTMSAAPEGAGAAKVVEVRASVHAHAFCNAPLFCSLLLKWVGLSCNAGAAEEGRAGGCHARRCAAADRQRRHC